MGGSDLPGRTDIWMGPAYSLLGPEWTGPGGIGDYIRSNGNTHEVVNAAHSMGILRTAVDIRT